MTTAPVSRPGALVPNPVFCISDACYRDVEVAEAVCAGRFTHIGVTLELGTEPDWRAEDMHPDEEWRIDWIKFYYGLDLAHAFGVTGEPRFLRTWEGLVDSWIRQMPVGLGVDTSDVVARRIANWVYAWNWFASAPWFSGLSSGLEDRIVESLGIQTRFVRENLTPARNHRTLELYSLFIVALAVPELDGSPELLRFAMAELDLDLRASFHPDGVHRECSTHYHMIALRSFLGARENARRRGLRLPEGYDEHLERACEFALHCHRPDGAIPAFSDSDTGAYQDLLELAASLLDRPDFLYAGSKGVKGTAPSRRYASFPAGGYYFQRSGWGDRGTPFERERFLLFDCGPVGEGGHGHYDALSVEMASGGTPLVVDPGRYTYSEHSRPNMRRWFKASAAHNTVTVDGLDQTPYWPGRPRGWLAEARLTGRWSAPGLDVLAGEVRSPCYEAAHRRRVVFVADEYWVIEDRLQGTAEHRYDLRFHLSPEAGDAVAVSTAGEASAIRAERVALAFLPARLPMVEAGWVAPLYGVKHEAPVVRVSALADTAVFITLVIPLEPGDPMPEARLRTDDSGRVVLEVDGVGADHRATDQIRWREASSPVEVDPMAGEPMAAWVRTREGRAVAWRECGLEEGGRASPGEAAPSVAWRAWDAGQQITSGGGAEL